MIGTPEEMRSLTHDLATSVWTLSVIGALFESGLAEHLRELRSLDDLAARCPCLSRQRIQRCLSVAVVAGIVDVTPDGSSYRLAEGARPFLEQPFRATLQGDIRSALMQSVAFLDASTGEGGQAGWRHESAALLQAQGDASTVFPPMLKAKIVPSLGDLAARLERPGARFLDVGVGVAALAIAMCRAFPLIKIVGVDTFEVPLTIARENVARANLTDRIDLRHLKIEELREEASFDLAWLPSFFIASSTLGAALARVSASLRPGGWLLFPIASSAGGERHRVVFQLINELWGGPLLSSTGAESLLKEAGLSSVQTLPGPPWAPALVVGQR